MTQVRSEDCLFCHILAGTIPAEVVAESGAAIAIRDIAPVAPTHVLVISRRHVEDAHRLTSSDGDLLAEMIGLAQDVASAEQIDASGYRLVWNVGDDGGNTVAHLHLHVIGGRSMSWPPG